MKELFLWEIKKNVKKNAIIGVGVTLLVLLILIAIVMNWLSDILKSVEEITAEVSEEGMVSPEEEESNEQPMAWMSEDDLYLSEDALNMMLENAKSELEMVEEAYKEDKSASLYSERFQLKSKIKILEFAKEKGYYNREIQRLGWTNGLGGSDLDAEAFVEMYKSIVLIVVLIYGVILGSKMFASEYKAGTIKLLMTRPISKNALTTAKLLALYAIMAVAYFVPILVSYVYGAIALGSHGNEQILYSFNAMTANVSTVGAMLFGSIMLGFINILILVTIAFSLGTITKNAAIGLIIPLVVSFVNIGSLLNYIGVTAFLLSNALSLDVFFGVSSVPYYGNFFISLAVLIVWTSAALAGVYVVTKKRDVY